MISQDLSASHLVVYFRKETMVNMIGDTIILSFSDTLRNGKNGKSKIRM